MRWETKPSVLVMAATAVGVVICGCSGPTSNANLASVAEPTASASSLERLRADRSGKLVESPEQSLEASKSASSSDGLSDDDAASAVRELAVKGRAPQTGYSREQFGPAWVDVDRNGCDTRNDMLRRELSNIEAAGSCKILAGTLQDPYTNRTIRFIYGGASEVDVDHVVALSDAWQKGASSWGYNKRVALANDPLNLQPTDAGANRQKGAGDAATWLPPSRTFRCEYVARQVAVKRKYNIWVASAEKAAIVRVLESCPGQKLPEPGSQPTTASNVGGQAVEQTDPERSSTSTGNGSGAVDPQFATCAAAIASGYGPYRKRSDIEYEWYIDRDRDGIVCE